MQNSCSGASASTVAPMKPEHAALRTSSGLLHVSCRWGPSTITWADAGAATSIANRVAANRSIISPTGVVTPDATARPFGRRPPLSRLVEFVIGHLDVCAAPRVGPCAYPGHGFAAAWT